MDLLLSVARLTRVSLLVILCLGIAQDAARATVRTVRAAGPGAGAPWDAASADLAGVLAVSVAGDEVWIATGTYKPAAPGGASTATFTIPPGVKVYGGFIGTEAARDQRPLESAANPTILSGDINGNGTSNSYHVVTAAPGTVETVLDRLTVTAGIGRTLLDAADITSWAGAGLYSVQANLIVSDCIIRDCVGARVVIDAFYFLRSPSSGGAVYVSQGRATFLRCVFASNRTQNGGSADCRSGHTLTSTPGGSGGAVYLANTISRFEGCRFESNSAGAGGIGNDCGSSSFGNPGFGSAGAGGSGGAIAGLNGTTQIIGCTFLSNIAGDGGAAAFGPNTSRGATGAGGNGGAISWTGGTAEITNCDFRLNRSGSGGPFSNGGIPAAGGDGGAVWASGGVVQITSSGFAANSTGGGTAAMQEYSVNGSPGCILPAGHGGRGGAMASAGATTLALMNLTLYGNSTGPGGAGYAPSASLLAIYCPLNPNDCLCRRLPGGEQGQGAAIFAGAAAAVQVFNSIIWNNSGPGPAVAGLSSVRSSCTQDAPVGDRVISIDPRLSDPANGQYAPRPSSPCIDRGDSTLLPPMLATDLVGMPRFVDAPRVPDRGIAGGGGTAVVDMGAVEFQGAGCAADADGSGSVDVADIFFFLAAYFAQDAGVADVNGVGGVSVQDLFEYLAVYFAGC